MKTSSPGAFNASARGKKTQNHATMETYVGSRRSNGWLLANLPVQIDRHDVWNIMLQPWMWERKKQRMKEMQCWKDFSLLQKACEEKESNLDLSSYINMVSCWSSVAIACQFGTLTWADCRVQTWISLLSCWDTQMDSQRNASLTWLWPKSTVSTTRFHLLYILNNTDQGMWKYNTYKYKTLMKKTAVC